MTAFPAKAMVLVSEFMARTDKLWVWETVIEDVAPLIGADARDRQSEFVYAAARVLRRELPRKKWKDAGAAEVLAIIARTAKETIDGATPFNITELAARKERLLSRLAECSTRLIEKRVPLESAMLPARAGVYCLFRALENRFPSYIGESSDLMNRVWKHKSWWGNAPMFVSFVSATDFPELGIKHERLAVESFVVALFPGVMNA